MWGFAISETAIDFDEAFRDLDPMPAVILGPGRDWEHLRVRRGRPGDDREMDRHVSDLVHDTLAFWAFLEAGEELESRRWHALITGDEPDAPLRESRTQLRDALFADNPHLRAWAAERHRIRPGSF